MGIDAAKARLEKALSEMWQLEAASRAAIENGTEEGLGDSSESAPIAFPEDIQMEESHEPVRIIPPPVAAHPHPYEDQMVPSITSSLLRVEEEEASSDLRNSTGDSRAEVPINVHVQQTAREGLNQEAAALHSVHRNARPQTNTAMTLRNAPEDSTAESSSTTSRRERDGGVVPVWSPPASSYSEQLVGDENGLGPSSSYLQTHPQSHQLMNWRRLPQTG